jgi:hypothetical protein
MRWSLELLGEVRIEERSFVAKGAPLDDGQKRFGAPGSEFGEEADRVRPHPLLRGAKSAAPGKAKLKTNAPKSNSKGEGNSKGKSPTLRERREGWATLKDQRAD